MVEDNKLTYFLAKQRPILALPFARAFVNEPHPAHTDCNALISKLTPQFVMLNYQEAPPRFNRILAKNITEAIQSSA